MIQAHLFIPYPPFSCPFRPLFGSAHARGSDEAVFCKLSRIRKTMRPPLFAACGFHRPLLPPIDEMIDGQYGVPKDHPGACIPHHRAYPFPHRGFVAVDRTLGTRGFPRLEWTEGEPFPGIIQELMALRAGSFWRIVMIAAEHPDHRLDGLLLPRYAGMPGRGT
jgi:hypothetical protein